jgi:hypothetical protein
LPIRRDRTAGHFTTEEAEFLLRLAVPMAKALRTALTCVSSPTTTHVPPGPGTLILDVHNAFQATTPEALFPAPMPVLSVSVRRRSLPASSGASSTAAQDAARVRTRTPAGHWLTIKPSTSPE